MGMYDSVIFTCPECGGDIEEQSKASYCTLSRYDSKEIPANIARDIEGNIIVCGCGEEFVVELVDPPKPELVVARIVKVSH